eukprot:5497529-Amphidinium_carterae.1
MSQQVVEVIGNGSANQYMNKFPDGEMNAWMRRFSEKQLRIKGNNAKTAVAKGLYQTRRFMPEIPSALLNTMAEADLAYAMD